MTATTGTARPAPRRGSTLLELTVVVCITGILAAMAVPSFRRAVEQARVDQAGLTLRAIWAAQRFHKLDTGDYATDGTDPPKSPIEVLRERELLDGIDTATFIYTVDQGGFPVRADRRQSFASGYLQIDEQGVITGQIDCEGRALRPNQ